MAKGALANKKCQLTLELAPVPDASLGLFVQPQACASSFCFSLLPPPQAP